MLELESQKEREKIIREAEEEFFRNSNSVNYNGINVHFKNNEITKEETPQEKQIPIEHYSELTLANVLELDKEMLHLEDEYYLVGKEKYSPFEIVFLTWGVYGLSYPSIVPQYYWASMLVMLSTYWFLKFRDSQKNSSNKKWYFPSFLSVKNFSKEKEKISIEHDKKRIKFLKLIQSDIFKYNIHKSWLQLKNKNRTKIEEDLFLNLNKILRFYVEIENFNKSQENQEDQFNFIEEKYNYKFQEIMNIFSKIQEQMLEVKKEFDLKNKIQYWNKE